MPDSTPSPQPPQLPRRQTLPVIPIAGMGKRVICSILDFTLIYAFAFLVLTKFLLPWLYPETIPEFYAWYDKFQASYPNYAPVVLSSAGEEGLVFSSLFLMMSIWFYFMISESVTQGSSLGKSVFGLRVISMRGTPPTIIELTLRATVKAFCFTHLILLLFSSIVFALNRQRRTAHDILGNTLVVESHRLTSELR